MTMPKTPHRDDSAVITIQGSPPAATLLRQIADAVNLLPALAPPDPDDRYHVRTLTTLWLAGVSETSRKGYYQSLADWLSWCARHSTDPMSARRADTDAWKAAMTAVRRGKNNVLTTVPAARATIAKRLAVISSWYRYLIANEIAVGNPAAATPRPTAPRQSPLPALDASETSMFLDWLIARAERLGSEAAWRDAAHLHLLFGTGLRITAACQAGFENLGSESGHTVLRYRAKSRDAGDDWDWVPLTPALLEVLRRYWRVRAVREIAGKDVRDEVSAGLTGYLFVSTPHPHQPERTGGAPLNQKHVHRQLRALARQAGLAAWETITPHSARRTAGTLALAAGATLAQVQDLLGHADPRTTRRYDAQRHRLESSPVWALADVLAAGPSRDDRQTNGMGPSVAP